MCVYWAIYLQQQICWERNITMPRGNVHWQHISLVLPFIIRLRQREHVVFFVMFRELKPLKGRLGQGKNAVLLNNLKTQVMFTFSIFNQNHHLSISCTKVFVWTRCNNNKEIGHSLVFRSVYTPRLQVWYNNTLWTGNNISNEHDTYSNLVLNGPFV